MKAERRHELQHNQLADALGTGMRDAQPYVKPIVFGLIAVVILGLAAAYFISQGRTQRGQAWAEFYSAADTVGDEQRIKELSRVATNYPNSAPGLWALQLAADARLQIGANKQFADRIAGDAELERAKSDYQIVLQNVGALGRAEGQMLRERATYGLAVTYESLADVEKATAEYEKVAKTWPESALGKASAARVAQLKNLKGWYEWYAKVDPSKIQPSPRRQQGLPPGMQPREIYDDLPNDLDLSLPPPLDPTSPAGVNGDDPLGLGTDFAQPPAAPAETTPPAEGSAAPVDDAPAEAPAAETPATDAPATDAPATDAPATDAPATDAPASDAPASEAPTTEAPAAP